MFVFGPALGIVAGGEQRHGAVETRHGWVGRQIGGGVKSLGRVVRPAQIVERIAEPVPGGGHGRIIVDRPVEGAPRRRRVAQPEMCRALIDPRRDFVRIGGERVGALRHGVGEFTGVDQRRDAAGGCLAGCHITPRIALAMRSTDGMTSSSSVSL